MELLLSHTLPLLLTLKCTTLSSMTSITILDTEQELVQDRSTLPQSKMDLELDTVLHVEVTETLKLNSDPQLMHGSSQEDHHPDSEHRIGMYATEDFISNWYRLLLSQVSLHTARS